MRSLGTLLSAGLIVGTACSATAAPSILSIQPESGSKYGGNTFNIEATGVAAGFKVYFDDIEVDAYKDGNIVSGYTPAHGLGEVVIRIVNPDTSSDTAPFDYVPFTVTSVETVDLPSSPVVTGTVAIYGTGLSDTYTNAYFDGLPASREGVVSSTRLLFVPPMGLSGVVDVSVEDHDGSVITFPDAYEWVPPVVPPEPSEFVPGEGDVAGGERIELNIPGHTSYKSISFGETPALFTQSYFIEYIGSDFGEGFEYRYTLLRITVPPGTPGYVDVTFENDERLSTFADGWRYVDQPANHKMEFAITIDAEDSIEGSNSEVLSRGIPFNIGNCAPSDRSLFYLVNSLAAGTLNVGLCAEQMYGAVQVFTPDFAQSYCADLDGCPTDSPDTTLLTLPVEPCENYYIRVASAGIGQEAQGGDFTLTTSFTPEVNAEPIAVAHDEPADAADLPADTIVRFHTTCGTRTELPTLPTYPGVDFWCRFEATQAGELEFLIEGVDTYSAWGLHNANLEELAAGISFGNVTQQTAMLPEAGTFYLRIVKEHIYVSPVFVSASYPTELPEGEGLVEGEGSIDGEGTQEVEGTREGEGLLEGEGSVEGDGTVDGEGLTEGTTEGDEHTEGEGSHEGEGLLEGATEGEGDGSESSFHMADTNDDTVIELDELLRVIQFRNSGALHCDATTEDGFAPGPGNQSCVPHTADYAPADWRFSLSETLRMIQLYNAKSYVRCQSGEDGFCI